MHGRSNRQIEYEGDAFATAAPVVKKTWVVQLTSFPSEKKAHLSCQKKHELLNSLPVPVQLAVPTKLIRAAGLASGKNNSLP